MCKMDTYNASDIYTEIHLWFKFHFVIYQSSINNLTNNLSSDKNETRYIPYLKNWKYPNNNPCLTQNQKCNWTQFAIPIRVKKTKT